MAREIKYSGDIIGKQVQTHYSKILGELGKKWDTDIELILCHGKHDLVPQELSFDKFYIFVQLLPREFEGVKKHSIKTCKLNGKEVVFPVKDDGAQKCPQGDTLSFTTAPKDAELIRDDTGACIAVIHDGALYILNDFIHTRSKDELETGGFILDYVVNYVITKSSLLHHLKAGVEEKSKRALEAALKMQFKQRLDKEITQLKAAKDTIAQYEKGIVEAGRKIFATEKIVSAIKMNIEDVPRALEKTWIELQKMANSTLYSTISFTKTGIKAITTPIFIKHSSKEYDMGRYEVNICFSGETKIYALDKKETGSHHDHPHISSGAVCWGNFAGYIPKLIGSSEFDVALVQISTFLCHYDAASPYRSIEHWPERKKEVKKVEKADEPKVRI